LHKELVMMQEKSNEATSHRPEGDRIIDATLVSINLPLFIEQIKTEKAWKDKDRNAITVFKTNGLCILLIALHKGAEMTKHTAAGMISVQVLEGRIEFTTDDQSVELDKGQMLALHESIPHRVLALEETIFLLTLTTKLPAQEEKVL
jgi:quercetin dioxygenase-like cupin family protein